MVKFGILGSLALSLAVTVTDTVSAYRHKIEPYSFDTKKFEYPLEFTKLGTTVALKDVIKLLPKIENRFGGLFMSQVSSKLFASSISLPIIARRDQRIRDALQAGCQER